MKISYRSSLRLLFLILGIIFINHLRAARPVKTELPVEDLNRLNRAIAASDLYMHDRMQYIDSLEACFHALPRQNLKARCDAALRVSVEYLPMRADSALTYSEIALRLAEEDDNASRIIDSRIARINALSTAGIFTRALADFQSINPQSLTPAQRIPYWMAGRKLYGYMRNYVEGDRRFFNDYTRYHNLYSDSLVAHLPETDPTRRFYLGERLVESGHNGEARQIFEGLLSTLDEESNLYGMTAFQMGVVCRNEGDPTGYASYMAKAAVSDIRGCVKDGLALPALAEWLYQHGELGDAFKYINFALQDAMTGNVRMRTVSIAALLPGIDEAYKEKINASRDELMVYFLLVTFLFLLAVALSIILLRTIRRGKNATRKLAQTAKLQESYIGSFIGLCSSYASRLESLQKLVIRKISSGQSDELMKMIKSGKIADERANEEFYKALDSAMGEIYPDFLSNINRLLRPEERYDEKRGEILPPEIRIYAFVRLGVTSSTRIAQILNYSVATVYNYRNRLRSKAISRDTFDDDIMKLGSAPVAG